MSDERSKRDGRSEEFDDSPSANDVATGSEAGRSDADTSSGDVTSSSAATPSGKRLRSGSGVSMSKAAAASTTATKNRPTKARQSKAGQGKAKADKRPNIFVRLLQFLREVVTELRKVIWPNKKQMVTYTSVVLVFLAFMVAFISGLDLLFIKGVGWLFG